MAIKKLAVPKRPKILSVQCQAKYAAYVVTYEKVIGQSANVKSENISITLFFSISENLAMTHAKKYLGELVDNEISARGSYKGVREEVQKQLFFKGSYIDNYGDWQLFRHQAFSKPCVAQTFAECQSINHFLAVVIVDRANIVVDKVEVFIGAEEKHVKHLSDTAKMRNRQVFPGDKFWHTEAIIEAAYDCDSEGEEENVDI